MLVISTYRWAYRLHSTLRLLNTHIYSRNNTIIKSVSSSFKVMAAMSATFRRYTSIVQQEFVQVDGVKTSVLKIGHLKDGLSEKSQRVMMLIIPGNPGVPHYYEDFMQELYNEAEGQVPVWTLGHACHVRPPGETLSISDIYATQRHVCGLEAQIAHKVKFIHDNIPPDVSLILIGHSIGCYMILNMLNKLTPNRVLHCFLLFPTIERMAVSPNGKRLTPIFSHLRWLIVIIAFFFSIFPRDFRLRLIQWWYKDLDFPKCVPEAILETVNPWTANFTTYLAKLEMGSVVQLQKDLLQKHCSKLSLYYGACDHWVPQNYYNELVTEFPKLDARLCDLNLKHAFVIDTQEGRIMAKIVWLWAQSHCSSELSCLGNDGSRETWAYDD